MDTSELTGKGRKNVLSPKQRAYIRKAVAAGTETQASIAKRYGVSRQAVNKVVQGRSYAADLNRYNR